MATVQNVPVQNYLGRCLTVFGGQAFN